MAFTWGKVAGVLKIICNQGNGISFLPGQHSFSTNNQVLFLLKQSSRIESQGIASFSEVGIKTHDFLVFCSNRIN